MNTLLDLYIKYHKLSTNIKSNKIGEQEISFAAAFQWWNLFLYVLLFITQGHLIWENKDNTLTMQTDQ